MAVNINAPGAAEPLARKALIPLTQKVALSRTTALPGLPTDGDTYIVPSGAGSNPNEIAVRIAGAWQYLVPAEGWLFYVADENKNYQFNGTVWVVLAGATAIEISFFIPGTYSSLQTIMAHLAATAFTLPSSLTGSTFTALIAATASTTVKIQKNGADIGTLVWAAAGTVPTVTFASSTAFAVGDLLTLIAPSSPDATLADIAGAFKGAL